MSELRRRKKGENTAPNSSSQGKRATKKTLSPWVVYLRESYASIAFLVLLSIVVCENIAGAKQLRPFVHLPYFDESDGLYGTGADDLKFVFSLVLAILVLRWIVTTLVFKSIANATVPGLSKSAEYKYTDMGWQLVWYTVSWVASVYFLYTLTGFDLAKCFNTQNYPPPKNPHTKHSYWFKFFYLTELAFWLQMILITLIEEKRKDFPVMMMHHFLTSGLIGSSYYCNFAWFGTAVLAEQDFADIFLPLAKLFKYSKLSTLADITFAFFAVAWIPTRHGLFFVLYKTAADAPKYVTDANPYDPSKGAYLSRLTINIYLVVLGLFQCLLLIWLKDILKAVYKALTSKDGNVEDHRSDSDD